VRTRVIWPGFQNSCNDLESIQTKPIYCLDKQRQNQGLKKLKVGETYCGVRSSKLMLDCYADDDGHNECGNRSQENDASDEQFSPAKPFQALEL